MVLIACCRESETPAEDGLSYAVLKMKKVPVAAGELLPTKTFQQVPPIRRRLTGWIGLVPPPPQFTFPLGFRVLLDTHVLQGRTFRPRWSTQSHCAATMLWI